MSSYFATQWKRVMKTFPFILLVTVVLFAVVAVLLFGMLRSYADSEENTVFSVGITGDTDNEMLQVGIAAFQSFDESRFTIDFVEMEEAQAEQALATGDIYAYLLLPEDFMDKALVGDMEPMYYVTSAGANNLATMFKNEITSLATGVVISSQQGSFGLQEALEDNGIQDEDGELVNQLALEYTGAILKRAEAVTVQELGISEGMRMSEYYLCGMAILFLMLLGLPFVTLYAGQDRALHALLLSKGVSSHRQVFSEWWSHFVALVCLIGAVFLPPLVLSAVTGVALPLQSGEVWIQLVILFVPVLLMISTLNMFIFELGSNVVGSGLLHFFTTLCLCYVSGCFYPVYTFPRAVQAVEQFLPTGVARELLAMPLTGDFSLWPMVGVLLYGGLFMAATLLVRARKLRRREGVA